MLVLWLVYWLYQKVGFEVYDCIVNVFEFFDVFDVCDGEVVVCLDCMFQFGDDGLFVLVFVEFFGNS